MTTNTVKKISVKELKTKMDAEPNLYLIDVREQHEWDEHHIPGAIHIPKDIITQEITALISNKKQPIYLHCRSGVRSLYAAERLLELGYEEVYSVDGGITGWANSGYPIK